MEQPTQLREASDYDIHDTFRALGRLWASEQIEGDDDGVSQVEALVGLLREFAAHEETEQPQDGWLPYDSAYCY